MKWLKFTAPVCTITLLLFVASTAFAKAPHLASNDVFWWWGDPAGTSNLVRKPKGISGNLTTSLANAVGSTHGQAVTVWLVIFNDPGECATAPCSESDLFNPDVMPDVLYGGGNLVGAAETVTVGFNRKAGDNSGSVADLFGMPTDGGEPFGLIYPSGAEIHYVVRMHGPMVPHEMPGQIQGYEGGCVDFAPFGYFPPVDENDLYLDVGQCQDVQFAINEP